MVNISGLGFALLGTGAGLRDTFDGIMVDFADNIIMMNQYHREPQH